MTISGSCLESAGLNKFGWVQYGFGARHSRLSQDGMASLAQIHSGLVLRVSGAGCAGEADALISNTPGLAISVRTADCFPILLVDSKIRAVAAIHAGWRGTAAEIVCRTLDTMRAEFNTSPSDVVAAIGPGIGPCCYEVGEEVARQFENPGFRGAKYLDLAAIHRAQLIQAGVLPSQIDTLGRCTQCEPALFHSYRRDKEKAGRMISFIGMKIQP